MESESPPSQAKNSSSASINAFSRVLAVVLLMLAFGIGGSYLDRWLKTSFFTLIGFVFGGMVMVIGMLYVVKASEYDRKNQKSGSA